MARRLLVFNCHEAWVSQLDSLDFDLDVIVDLPGRPVTGWDANMRPFPRRARAISLADAQAQGGGWHCVVASNISDLMDSARLAAPRVLVIHVTLDGRLREEATSVTPEEMRAKLATYVRAQGIHVVAVSKLKGRSWGFTDDVVPLSVDVADYPPWRGDVAEGLRVSNGVLHRAKILLWELHQAAFDGLPVRLVGRNPELPGVEPSRDWAHLKELLAAHRFFVHTAEPQLEDGYNTATLEAMAAGLPIVGNKHPTSPVRHGASGFLSDDPKQLRAFAERLLGDHALARAMGEEARRAVDASFSRKKFAARFSMSIEQARARHAKAAKRPR